MNTLEKKPSAGPQMLRVLAKVRHFVLPRDGVAAPHPLPRRKYVEVATKTVMAQWTRRVLRDASHYTRMLMMMGSEIH
jgi:hypothetical protein